MEASSKLKFVALVGGSVVIALVLVAVGISLYFSSGTAQLDLSRPGYQSVRDRNKEEDVYKGFSSSGNVNDKALDEFEKLYNERAQNATSLDAFNPDVLSESVLGLDEAAAPSE